MIALQQGAGVGRRAGRPRTRHRHRRLQPARPRPAHRLGRGLLTGSVAAAHHLADDDFRRTLPRWQAENLDANLALVRRVRTIADQAGATSGQVAPAWLLAQGHDVVPIPGTKRRAYLTENLAAAHVTLTPDQLRELSDLRPAGERYPDMDWVRGESAN